MNFKHGFVAVWLGALVIWYWGCSGGGDGTVQPVQHPPTVTITTGPADTINYSDTAVFTWAGDDPDQDLAGYYAGLDGNLTWTTDTTASYSGFTQGTSHVFLLVAKDAANALSDTADWTFAVYPVIPAVSLTTFGQGINDDDSDGFWSQFAVRWQPTVSGAPISLRLVVSAIPSYGSGSEWSDSTV
ncbi:MAG: hypothetical protein ABH878_05350, partial [bacterium]